MSRIAKISAVVLPVALLGIVAASPPSHGQDGQSPLMPPQSHAFGNSFEEWNVLQTQWALATGHGSMPVRVGEKAALTKKARPGGRAFFVPPRFCGQRRSSARRRSGMGSSRT